VGLVEIISVTLFMVYLTTLSIVSSCVTMDGWLTVNSELDRMRKDGRGGAVFHVMPRSLTDATEEN